ncbi:MAG: diaminopimelate epimerase [Robiginitomaculum sp.]|nr:MAG: diaminopimelate epimerase [Robiginitomaculum sp.]
MKYVKMNGCGNEFAIFDLRHGAGGDTLSSEAIRKIADANNGVGCDQIMAIEKTATDADAFMRIWNGDGEEVSACGNGTRAIAWLLMQEGSCDAVSLQTRAGILHARRAGDHQVQVDMGPPKLGWEDIPLAERMDTRGIDIKVGPIDAPVLMLPGAVNMGNPHAIFFVDDVETIAVQTLGPMLEHHPLFPQAANIGFAEVRSRDEIRLKVWERGAGLTKACGTGACAALVACHRRNLCDRKAKLILDGGELVIEWRAADDHILMTGPVEWEYEGEIEGV